MLKIKTTISGLTPAKAVKVLAKEGMVVTEEEAKGILEFLTKLAQTTLHNEDSRSIYQGEHRRAS